MAEKKLSKAVRFENPLMPDERLRQMYTAMVQMRMLEEHLAGERKSAGARGTIRGEEAARASTVLSLESGDLLSDCAQSAGMDLLLGVKLSELKRRNGAGARKAGGPELGESDRESYPRRLPQAGDPVEQLQISLGVAVALKAQRNGRVLLVFARAGEAKSSVWEKTLGVAGSRELPVIFVVLPEPRGGPSRALGELSGRSRAAGVAGFAVDGSDAIALYRVMQESLLRARSDGGSVLIECIPFHLKTAGRRRAQDPVERLRELLLAKGVAGAGWMDRTRSAFSRRLGG